MMIENTTKTKRFLGLEILGLTVLVLVLSGCNLTYDAVSIPLSLNLDARQFSGPLPGGSMEGITFTLTARPNKGGNPVVVGPVPLTGTVFTTSLAVGTYDLDIRVDNTNEYRYVGYRTTLVVGGGPSTLGAPILSVEDINGSIEGSYSSLNADIINSWGGGLVEGTLEVFSDGIRVESSTVELSQDGGYLYLTGFVEHPASPVPDDLRFSLPVGRGTLYGGVTTP